MALVGVKNLKEKLRQSAPVDIRGEEYRIQAVSLLLFVDDAGEMWKLAREDSEKLKERLQAVMASPSYDAMRKVLVKGMVHPKVVSSQTLETEESICVDTLLVDYELASELFIAIAKQSMS